MRTRSNSAAQRYKYTSDSDYSDTEHMGTNTGTGSSDEKPHPHHNPNAMPCCIKACTRYGTRLLGSLRSNWDLKQNHSGRVCEGHYRKSLRMYKKMQSLSNAAAKGSTTRKRKGSQGDGSTRVTRSQCQNSHQHESVAMDMAEEVEAEEDIDMADIPPTEASEEPPMYHYHHHHQQQQQQQHHYHQWTDQQRLYQQQQYGTVYPINPQPYVAVTSIQGRQQQQQQQHYPSSYYGRQSHAHPDYRYVDQKSLYQQQQQQQDCQQYEDHDPQKYQFYGQSILQAQTNQTQQEQQLQQRQQLSRQSQTRNMLPPIQLDIERQPVNLMTPQQGHIVNGESGDSLVRSVVVNGNGSGNGNAAITPQTPEPWRRQFRQFCEFVLKSENVM